MRLALVVQVNDINSSNKQGESHNLELQITSFEAAVTTELVDCMNFKEFVFMNEECPHLLAPVFVMQNTIALNTLGISWWSKQREKCMDARRKAAMKEALACEVSATLHVHFLPKVMICPLSMRFTTVNYRERSS